MRHKQSTGGDPHVQQDEVFCLMFTDDKEVRFKGSALVKSSNIRARCCFPLHLQGPASSIIAPCCSGVSSSPAANAGHTGWFFGHWLPNITATHLRPVPPIPYEKPRETALGDILLWQNM